MPNNFLGLQSNELAESSINFKRNFKSNRTCESNSISLDFHGNRCQSKVFQRKRMVEESVTKLCETAQANLKEQTQALAMLQKEHVKLAVDKKNELNTVILLVKFLML